MKKIVFWCNGSKVLGYGHIYRSIRLAKMLRQNANIIVLTNKENECLDLFDINELPYVIVDEETAFNEFNNVDILILDQPIWSKEQLILKLRNKVRNIVAFDDKGGGAKHVDLLINAVIGLPYTCPTRSYEGVEYIIFDEELEKFSKDRSDNLEDSYVLVCFGGSDPNNISELIIPFIRNDSKRNYVLVLGPGYEGYQDFINAYSNISNLDIYHNVTNMSELVSNASYCIVSGGLTLYECVFLKKKTIVLCQIPQQSLTAQQLKKYGPVHNMGIIDSTSGLSANLLREAFVFSPQEEAGVISLENGIYKIIQYINEL